MCITQHNMSQSPLSPFRKWPNKLRPEERKRCLLRGRLLPQSQKLERETKSVPSLKRKEPMTLRLTLVIRLPHLPTLPRYPSEFQIHLHTLMGCLLIIHPHLPNKVMLVLNKVPCPRGINLRVTFDISLPSTQARSGTPVPNPKHSEAGAVPPISGASTGLIPGKGIG